MLSALGWLGILVCLLALGVLLVVQIYPFLSVNAPIVAEMLVVEGWLSDDALKGVIAEFHQGLTPKSLSWGRHYVMDPFLTEYKSHADLAAATLIFLGVAAEKIVAIPVPQISRDRTKTSALILKQWLSKHAAEIQAINLYSQGPHARRSWRLFRQALSPDICVGIVAGMPEDYEPGRWWDYSAGVRSVLSEAIGYVYAWLPNPATQTPIESIEEQNQLEREAT